MHLLASAIPPEKLKNDSNLNKLINETRKCMEGYKTREEAEQIMDEVWKYTLSNFPEYLDKQGQIKHEDASEYLRRLIEIDKDLKEQTEIYLKLTMKCHNNKCEALKSELRKITNLIHPEFTESTEHQEYTIQEILNKYMLENETKPCLSCNHLCEISKEIQIAPETIIIEIPKGAPLEAKRKSLVKDATKLIKISQNGDEIEYKVAGIVIHKGEETETGHYVMNRYNQSKEKWEQFDDHLIIHEKNFEKENEEGVLYILNKIKTQQEMIRNNEIRNPLYSSIAKRPPTQQPISQRYTSQPKTNNEQSMTQNRNNYSPQPRQHFIDQERERENIQNKKNNIIIRGLKETKRENDIKNVVDLNRAIGNEDFNRSNILNITRLGEKNERERPLKVELDSFVTKLRIMRNAKYLLEKPEYYNISIQHDLTKFQMIEYRRLIQRSMEDEANDKEGNFKYRVRGPPGQWNIVKFSKNSHH